MAYFPFFVDLEDKMIMIVGGGDVAERRVRVLLDFGCRLTVISPALTLGLQKVIDHPLITYHEREYRTGDIEACSPFLVISAAGMETDEQVVRDARELGIPANNASDRTQSDFYFPGIARNGEIVCGITCSGSDHKKTADVSAAVRKLIKETY